MLEVFTPPGEQGRKTRLSLRAQARNAGPGRSSIESIGALCEVSEKSSFVPAEEGAARCDIFKKFFVILLRLAAAAGRGPIFVGGMAAT